MSGGVWGIHWGWVGVSGGGWSIIVGGGEWGWVHCLIMPR